MTQEETKQAIEIMKAFANGKEVEYQPRYGWSQWYTCTLPDFDWRSNKYRIKPKQKFDPKTLKPFDKVLVYDSKNYVWSCDFFSFISGRDTKYPYYCVTSAYRYVIPYNDETKHLLGTYEEAPEKYRYWED